MVNVLFDTDVRCMCIIMMLVGVLFALLASWLAIGQWRWMGRASVTVVAFGSLITVRAYSPALILMATFTPIVSFLLFIRWSLRRRNQKQSSVAWPWMHYVVVGLIVGIVVASQVSQRVLAFPYAFGRYERLLLYLVVVVIVTLAALRLGQCVHLGTKRIAQRSNSDIPSLRFNLRDILGLTFCTAIVLLILTTAWREHTIADWHGFLVATAVYSVLSIAMILLAHVHEFRLVGQLVVAAFALAAYSLAPILINEFGNDFMALTGPWTTGDLTIFYYCYPLLLLACQMLLVLGELTSLVPHRFSRTDKDTGRTRAKLATKLFVFGTLGFVFFPVTILYPNMTGELNLPKVRLKSGSYESLVQHAESADDANPFGRTRDALRKQDPKNANAVTASYEAIHKLLQNPDEIAIDIRALSAAYPGGILPETTVLRSLVLAWDTESKSLAWKRDYDAAAQYDLDSILVGSCVTKGGLIVHALAGVAFETVGITGLTRSREKLSVGQKRQALQTLLQVESRRESITLVFQRDDAIQDKEIGWQYRFHLHAARAVLFDSAVQYSSPSKNATTEAFRRRDCSHRLMMTDLAIRVFQTQNQRLPKSLNELAPNLLPVVPIDPYSGEPLIYQSGKDQFVLYSVGTDGVDNGGTFGSEADSYGQGFDYDLDTVLR